VASTSLKLNFFVLRGIEAIRKMITKL